MNFKLALLTALLVVSAGSSSATTQTGNVSAPGSAAEKADTGTPGERLPTGSGIPETTAAIAERQRLAPASGPRPEHEVEYPDRSNLPQNPNAPAIASFPPSGPAISSPLTNIHTTTSSFDGATLTDTGAFPPDSMGTVGPTQFIVFVNGRIRSFTKAGVADGVINADPDVFFASVMTPVGRPVVLNFTSDPQVRYDRFTARWFMSIIDVPCTNATCTTTAANRWLLAVSDAASNGTITRQHGVDLLLQFQADPGTNFCDYPSLGIDVNALYVGCNMFTSAGRVRRHQRLRRAEDVDPRRRADRRHRVRRIWRRARARVPNRRAASTTSMPRRPKVISSDLTTRPSAPSSSGASAIRVR